MAAPEQQKTEKHADAMTHTEFKKNIKEVQILFFFEKRDDIEAIKQMSPRSFKEYLKEVCYPEIKKCPFCESDNVGCTYDCDGLKDCFVVWCKTCYAAGPTVDIDYKEDPHGREINAKIKAINLWNKRTYDENK